MYDYLAFAPAESLVWGFTPIIDYTQEMIIKLISLVLQLSKFRSFAHLVTRSLQVTSHVHDTTVY